MSEEPDVGDYEEIEKFNTLPDCPKCEFKSMRKMTECHLICENCGAHMDCSDKGSVW